MALKTIEQAGRLAKIVIGFTLLILGVVMLITPGPGLITIALGLALLGAEFVWARRLLNRLKAESAKARDVVVKTVSGS